MTLELRPELEQLVRQDMRAGAYTSMEEYLEKAVMLLHSQETWVTAHQDDIAAQIEEGWLAAERGELIHVDQLKAELDQRKRA